LDRKVFFLYSPVLEEVATIEVRIDMTVAVAATDAIPSQSS